MGLNKWYFDHDVGRTHVRMSVLDWKMPHPIFNPVPQTRRAKVAVKV